MERSSSGLIKVAVVGGGLSGLAAAYRLQQRLAASGRPFEIKLYETSRRVGGVAGTVTVDGFQLETGPDCFISEKPRGVALCKELGLTDELLETIPAFRRSFIAWRGRLHPIPEGFHLLAPSRLAPLVTSRLLSWPGKLRVLKDLWAPAYDVDDESLAAFVDRHFGREVLERLAQPLAGGIYSADPARLSLRATFPRFLDLQKKGSLLRQMLTSAPRTTQQSSGARYSLFMTLKDGLQKLVDALQAALRKDTIVLGTSVDSLEREAQGWRVRLSSGTLESFDAVCLACPAPAVQRLLAPHEPTLPALLDQIPYGDAVSAYLAFSENQVRRALPGTGFVIPSVEGKAVSACTVVHQKFAGRVPPGFVLLRAFAAAHAVPALLGASDAEVAARLLADIAPLLGLEGTPAITKVFRWTRALPQFTVGHLSRLQQIDERLAALPTLAVAGNWRKGVGVPDVIEAGESAAERLAAALQTAVR